MNPFDIPPNMRFEEIMDDFRREDRLRGIPLYIMGAEDRTPAFPVITRYFGIHHVTFLRRGATARYRRDVHHVYTVLLAFVTADIDEVRRYGMIINYTVERFAHRWGGRLLPTAIRTLYEETVLMSGVIPTVPMPDYFRSSFERLTNGGTVILPDVYRYHRLPSNENIHQWETFEIPDPSQENSGYDAHRVSYILGPMPPQDF